MMMVCVWKWVFLLHRCDRASFLCVFECGWTRFILPIFLFSRLDRPNCSFCLLFPKCDDFCYAFRKIFSIYLQRWLLMAVKFTLHSSWQHWFVSFCVSSLSNWQSAKSLSPDFKRSLSAFSFVSSFRSPVSPKERESALCKLGKLFVFLCEINTSKHVTSRSVTFFST